MADHGDKATRRGTATVRQRWRDAVRDSTDPRIDSHTIAVAMALDRHMDAQGHTHTGVRTLAALARVSKNTVTDRIGRLHETGFLRIDNAGHGRSSRYQATILDPNCPTLWDTPHPVDNPKVSHPLGHLPLSSVPPGEHQLSHPVKKLSHPVGPTPLEPVDKTPERESAHARATTNGQQPHDPHPLLDRTEITAAVLAEGFAYHLTTRGRSDPADITDTIDTLVTRLAPTMSGPITAMVNIADALDALPNTHRRQWARELADDLYPPPTPPGPWT